MAGHEWSSKGFTDTCIHCGRVATPGAGGVGVEDETCPKRPPETTGWASIGDVAVVEMKASSQVYRMKLDTLEQVAMFNSELKGENSWTLEKKENLVTFENLAGLLRCNGIDCSNMINGRIIHIFTPNVSEDELRNILGDFLTGYKFGVNGTINSTHNKSIFYVVEVTKPNTAASGEKG